MKTPHLFQCHFPVIFFLLVGMPWITPSVFAANANLFVSAENSQFDNYMAGPQVIEVVVIDSDINDTDEGKGEPDVTVNGRTLRMVQGVDGNWYGYFADLTMARRADATVGLPGFGLDFGEFCQPDSDATGINLSQTDAFAIPRDVESGSNGLEAIGTCDSISEVESPLINHVVREAKDLSSPPRVGRGQIGLNETLWPLIQLYDLEPGDNVVVQYNKGGGVQASTLTFDTGDLIANLELDRAKYPRNSQVHLAIVDPMLNIDPTDEDSWTFGTNPSSPMLVYQAFDENGQTDADGTDGAVNINVDSVLNELMFGDNGVLVLDLDTQDTGIDVVNLVDNDDQVILAGDSAADAISAGGSFGPGSLPLTITEQGPNSGVFLSADEGDRSAIKVSNDALRGTSATVTYNEIPTTILTAFASATIDIKPTGSEWNSGEEIEIQLFDPDLNRNSRADEDLDVFNPDVERIPALQIGNPFTLKHLAKAELDGIKLTIKEIQPCSLRAMLVNIADDVVLQEGSTLLLTTKDTFADLYQSINDPTGPFSGFNFLNYDIRSVNLNLAGRPITAVDIQITDGQKTASFLNANTQAFLNFNDAVGDSIFEMDTNAKVQVLFAFHVNENRSIPVGTVLPVVCDFFSFGRINDGTSSAERISNQIIRLELEEKGDNSSIFEGELKFTMLNQLNMLDRRTYDFHPIADDPQFFIGEGLQGLNAPTVFYFDTDESGSVAIVSDHQNTPSHSGTVSFELDTYKVGDTVYVTLEDQDLNSDSNLLDIYTTVSPSANPDPAGDTVGKAELGNYTMNSLGAFGRLLEITFNGERWRSGLTENGGACGKAGVPNDGLHDATFSLIETEAGTSVFVGSFEIPDFYCSSKSGQLESTVGAQIGVHYVDYLTGENQLEVVSDSARVRSNSGSVRLDRKAYPVPFGSVDDFFPGENQSDKSNPDGDSIFPVHPTAVIADGDQNIDAKTEEVGPGDLIIHVRVNDPDLDRSRAGIDTIAQGEHGPVKIMISRGNTTLLLATAGGASGKPGVITVGDQVVPGVTRELGPMEEIFPDSGTFEVDLEIRYTDGPASTLGPITPDNGYSSLTGDPGVLGRFDQEPQSDSYCILEGDVISVEYNDQHDSTGNSSSAMDGAVFQLTPAALELDESVVTLGEEAGLTLIDKDLDLNSRSIEVYDMDLFEWSSSAGTFTLGDLGGNTDRFNPTPIKIRETAKDSGRFNVELTIPFDLDGQRILDNETVSLTFTDWGTRGGRYVGHVKTNPEVSFTAVAPPTSVSFATPQSNTAPEDDEPNHKIPLQLFVPYGDTITEDITVHVVDAGTGSANSDTDYRGFDPTPITFPAGSSGGDIKQFTISILHDVRREDDESIDLRLDSVQGPAVIGDTHSHQVLITDDEIRNRANPNLFISADNSQFNYHMSGPQVIEVVVVDSDINDTDEVKGEPIVTVNGKALRMVQAVDGNWYGYFADRTMAQIADSTVGEPGFGLDFGEFCFSNSDIIGIDLQETVGFAIPRDIASGSNGVEALGPCDTAIEDGHAFVNHVVREAKDANSSTNVPAGQLGINVNAWPFIQLYDLSPGENFVVQYHRASGVQSTTLRFDSVDEFTDLQLDRTIYPVDSQVSLTLTDLALNIDPTDEDSWTFGANSTSPMIVYQAFDENGQIDADGTAGAVNINVGNQLRDLMFEDSGVLILDVDSQNVGIDVVNLFDNNDQQIIAGNRAADAESVGGTFELGTHPLTLTELGPNSGIFSSVDEEDDSNLKTTDQASAGNSATLEYNDNQVTILTSFFDASIDIQPVDEEWNSGEEIPVVLVDPDANKNSLADEDLDVWNPNVDAIPALQMGNPFALENLELASLAGVDLIVDEVQPISQRAMLRVSPEDIQIQDGSTLVLTLSDTYADLYDSINDPSGPFSGFNFINYDIRSISNAIDINSFSIAVTDGARTTELTHDDFQDLINLENVTGDALFGMDITAQVQLIFTLNVGNNQTIPVGTVLPIVCDFFSFGKINDGAQSEERINNMIVRLELEETGDNTSEFDGSLEFVMLNQLNILDSHIYESLSTIDDEPTFIITGGLFGDQAPKVVYNDRGVESLFNTISDQQDVATHSGIVSFDAESYKVGDEVLVFLEDPDLNIDSDLIDIYAPVKSNEFPNDPARDSIGGDNLGLYQTNNLGAFGRLVEITFNGQRWMSGLAENGGACGEAGFPDDGLADAFFALIETDRDSGIFVGDFQIPDTYCNSSTGKIESTVGAEIGAHYVDYVNGDNQIVEVSDTASVVTVSGSVSLDRPIYPVPFGGVNDFFLDNSQSDSDSPNGNSIFPIHHTGIIADGDQNIDAQKEEIGTGDLVVHIRINDPDFDRSEARKDFIAFGEHGPIKIIAQRGDQTVVLATAGGTVANNGVITIGLDIVPGVTRELGPIEEIGPDYGIFELDFPIRYTDGPESVEGPVTPDEGYSSLNGETGVLGRFNQAPQEGSYALLVDDILVVEYTDPHDATGSQTTVTDSSTFDLRTGILQTDRSKYSIGDDIILTLTEPDFDLDNNEAELYTLDLIEWRSDAAILTIGELGGELAAFNPEPLTFRETGDSTGIFRAVMDMPERLKGKPLTPRDEIRLQYTDWGPEEGGYVGQTSKSLNQNISTSGFGATVELDQKIYSWTEKVLITIVAPDWNVDSDAVDSIGGTDLNPVSITTRGFRLDNYKLVEFGKDSGVFTGEITLTGFLHDADGDRTTGDVNGIDTNPQTTGMGPNSGFIETSHDDGITVAFEFSEHETIVGSALIRWNIGDLTWFLQRIGERDIGLLRLIEADMNLAPDAVDHVKIRVWSKTDPIGLQVNAVETQPGSGIFEASIEFTATDESSGNRLRVTPGDFLSAEYLDHTLPNPFKLTDSKRIEARAIFGIHPLERFSASNPRILDTLGSNLDFIKVGQQTQISVDLQNLLDHSQQFGYAVQIEDIHGFVVSLEGLSGALAPNQQFSPSISWIPTEAGEYEATIFIWDSTTSLSPLSPPQVLTFSVNEIGQLSTARSPAVVKDFSQASADFAGSGLSVRTNNSVYFRGDIIKLSGRSEGEFDNTIPLAILIKGPNNRSVRYGQFFADASGSFSTDFRAGGPLWEEEGIYRILVHYGPFSRELPIEFLNLKTDLDPVLALSPSIVNFGDIPVGQTSKGSVTLTNTSATDLIVDEISITGQDASRFIVNISQCSLAPSQQRILRIDFLPDRVGPFRATLDVQSNLGSVQANLFGVGIANDAPNKGVETLSLGKSVYTHDEELQFVGSESDGSQAVFVIIRLNSGRFTGLASDPASDSNGQFATIPRRVSDLFASAGTYEAIAFTENQGENNGVALLLDYDGNRVTALHNLSVAFDKLNYQRGESAVLSLTGPPSETVSLLIIDPFDKLIGGEIPLEIGAEGQATYTLPLAEIADGVYTAVVSMLSEQRNAVFTLGLEANSNAIQINTTKLEYEPGDRILIFGNADPLVLLTLTLTDPDGNEIDFKETFSDKNGRIVNNDFRIPTNAEPGTWTVTARSGSSVDTTEFAVQNKVNANAPSGLTASAISPSQIQLSWFPPSDTFGQEIVEYVIEREIIEDVLYDEIGTSGTSTKFTVNGLQPNKTYSFVVNARLTIGRTPRSNSASATPSDDSTDPNHDDATPIIVKTDRASYTLGSTIVISGKINCTLVPSTDVAVDISVNESSIHNASVAPDLDGQFTHTVVAEGPDWIAPGTYTIRATYGAELFTESTFQVEANDVVFDAAVGKASYVRGEKITLSGNAATDNLLPVHAVTTILRNSSGRVIMIDQLEPDDNGFFSTTFIADGPLWTEIGSYTLSVHFGDQSETLTFDFGESQTAPDLIGHWKFDETVWTGKKDEVLDSSGLGNHGTSRNGAQIVASAKIDKAGEFDGADDAYIDLGRIESGDPLQLAGGGTLMGWFNQRPGDRLQRIFDKSTRGFGAKGYALVADPRTRAVSIFVWGSHYRSEVGVYKLYEWTHVAAVITESEFEIYVNGAKVNGAFVRGSAKLPSNVMATMRIGSRSHSSGREFNGFLDDLRIYGKGLTTSEIQRIYDEAPPNSALIAHYPFNEGNGCTTADSASGVSPKEGTLKPNCSSTGSDGPSWSNGVGNVGSALEFDGGDDYVDLGRIAIDHPLQLNTGGTLMGWFNQRPGDRLQRIFDKSTRGFGAKGYTLVADPRTRAVSIFIWGSHYRSEVGVYKLYEWTHVAAVIAESEFEIYVNGTKVNGAFVQGGAKLPTNVATRMRIGSRNHATNRKFNGFLDDLRIYNRTLSKSDINEIVDEASASSTPVASRAVTEDVNIFTGKAARSTSDLFLSQTIYEDAEDGKIAGWSVYGDGSVLNVKEMSGNRIISTIGALDGNPFRLGRDDSSNWDNAEEFTAYFAILMEEEAAVYFRVDTSEGEKYLCYRPGNETIDISDKVICFGLGLEPDGQWHGVTRDLANDLEQAIPNTTLISIKDFYVFGNMKLDDLILLRQSPD